ncbi:hypothetical protein BDV39DRAFT_167021, partial [Aspergillus sergii]
MESTGVHAALARSALVKRHQSFPPVRHPREVLVFPFSVCVFSASSASGLLLWWFPLCRMSP